MHHLIFERKRKLLLECIKRVLHVDLKTIGIGTSPMKEELLLLIGLSVTLSFSNLLGIADVDQQVSDWMYSSIRH